MLIHLLTGVKKKDVLGYHISYSLKQKLGKVNVFHQYISSTHGRFGYPYYYHFNNHKQYQPNGPNVCVDLLF